MPTVDLDKNGDARGMLVVDSDHGVIPTPFDLLRNPTASNPADLRNCPTCTMAFPLTKDAETGAVLDTLDNELFANMNLINGFIVSMPISLPFNMALDTATLTPANVKLFDVTDPATPTLISPDTYYVIWNLEGATAEPYKLTIINKSVEFLADPAPWKVGGRYVLALSENVTGTVAYDDSSTEVVSLGGHPLFYFIKDAEPLFDAKGYLRTDLLNQEDANGDYDPVTTMGLGLNVEYMRQVAAPLFSADILDPETTPALTVFSIKSNPEAIFLPGTTLGNIVPRPNDLAKDAPAADAVTLKVRISHPLKKATVTSDVIKVFKATDMTPVALSDVDYEEVTDGDGVTTYTITATPAALEPGTKYIAFITNGVTDEKGAVLSAGTYFALVRANNPLLRDKKDEQGNDVLDDKGEKVQELTSSIVAGNAINILIKLGNNPLEADASDWANAQSMLLKTIASLETLRQSYKPVFDGLAAAGIPRTSILSLWTFTTKAAE